MAYTKISEGFVSQRPPGTSTSSVAGPRCVVRSDGEIICTFVAQSALGVNDFKPMISRSFDGGNTWSEAQLIWPDLIHDFSIHGSVSSTPSGELLFFGIRTPIDIPGESFWSNQTQGMKQNELVWARSSDGGAIWSGFRVIPMPFPGSAEAPGAMCCTSNGRLLCCYAPYNTFDPRVRVKKNNLICLWSKDDGDSWNHSMMLRFPYEDSTGAVAWLVELSDGRLLGTAWHIRNGSDAPNVYAISYDSGETWGATLSTGIFGQSTSLVPLKDGRSLFIYNQRRYGDIGVWVAVVDPTEKDFGVQQNHCVWAAEKAAQKPGMINHDTWTSFAFGEPSAVLLPGDDILVTLWSAQHDSGEIAYVKFRLD